MHRFTSPWNYYNSRYNYIYISIYRWFPNVNSASYFWRANMQSLTKGSFTVDLLLSNFLCMFLTTLTTYYRRSGNLHVKNNSCEKLSRFRSIREICWTVDDCNIDKLVESSWRLVYTTRCQESQRSLAVVVIWTFNLVTVDLCASLFTDHRRVILFFACLFFAVGLDLKIILTAKFSRCMVCV